ncbi:MAG: PTS sugar transporter subunit IIA [bacterium]|nr:PTS sugar transporter subunit IIA [bacterium]
MIGLVIVTHGALGREFHSALEHVVGPQTQLETIAVDDDLDHEILLRKIRSSVKQVNDGDGVILLTDLFGSTPSNLAIDAINGSPIEMISGINLPMLISLATNRQKLNLKDTVVEAKSCGRRYIHVASDMLCQFPRPNSRS